MAYLFKTLGVHFSRKAKKRDALVVGSVCPVSLGDGHLSLPIFWCPSTPLDMHESAIEPGLRSCHKSYTTLAPTLELLAFISVALAAELSFVITWLQLWLLFIFTHIFNCLGGPKVKWKMKYIKYTKLNEYAKLTVFG